MLGVTGAIMKQAGLATGDSLDVTVELVPSDLASALAADGAKKTAWDKLSYTSRKERARSIVEARRPETRARRLDQVLRDLAG